VIPWWLVMAIGVLDLLLVAGKITVVGKERHPTSPAEAARYAVLWIPIGVILILAGLVGVSR
jgi:hypothetical protein